MGMTPVDYFASFIEGNCEDYRADPGDLRRAFNAAVSASHMADHYLHYNRRHHPQLVQQFADIGPFVRHLSVCTDGAFQDIRSIANAYKHLYADSTKQRDKHSSVSSCGAIEVIELDDGDQIEVSERQAIVVSRKDGTQSEFLPMLEKVVEYWRQVLYLGAA